VNVNPQIFKAYDVRGLYPAELDERVFHAIGRAFVTFLQARRIGVGCDMRLSSPALTRAFMEGARTQGADIVDYGTIATDMLYYGVGTDDLDGGAQITASHNPKQYNGAKLVGHEASPLSGDKGISDIREMLRGDRLPPPPAQSGIVTARDLLPGYLEHVLGFIDPTIIHPFRVVLDAGSGMAGLVAPPLFDRLPCQITRLCFEIDGTFPNHEANPLIDENRRHIEEQVLADRADIGIAWDGDADRCFFIDGAGQFVPGDFITALLAEAFFLKDPRATVIYDLRASHAIRDTAARYGGRALMNRVGHAFFKGRMREENAVFGGEVTGHYYFRENFYADNGFIPALLILELMSRKKQSLTELLAPLRARYFISGEINTKVAGMAVVEEKLDAIAERYADGAIQRLDGVSADFGRWHFNVRPSNTEPLLRLNLEADTPELMAAKRDEILEVIRT
jgi:phosphomannomutase